ncbi:helix-turn-helix domain-containing protein [Paenibacillus larvae]
MIEQNLLTIPQLAKRLRISKRKAYELRHQAGFPFYNLGERQIRVVWSEVLEWIKKEDESHEPTQG